MNEFLSKRATSKRRVLNYSKRGDDSHFKHMTRSSLAINSIRPAWKSRFDKNSFMFYVLSLLDGKRKHRRCRRNAGLPGVR